MNPRRAQLARMEPAHLIELAFTMALLEKQQNRLDGSSIGELSPLFHHIQMFLHEIATVVPYESILCAIAYGRHDLTVNQCASLVEENQITFPFSLLMLTCILVALCKGQGINLDLQTPIEDSAYFSWMSSKLLLKEHSKKLEIKSDFSFRDMLDFFKASSIWFGSIGSMFSVQKQKDSSLKYLAELLAKVDVLTMDDSDLPAISELSAVNLYRYLNSPVTILNEGRKKLQLAQIGAGCGKHSEENEKMISALEDVRGKQFNCCIAVLCGFMYQHFRVPFTEENPVTVLKTLQLYFGPMWKASSLKSRIRMVMNEDTREREAQDLASKILNASTLISTTKKCQKMVAKGTQVAKRWYDGKLRFLVSNIDKTAVESIASSSSDYIVYALEQKLKKLCCVCGITTEKSVECIVLNWESYFKSRPLLDISKSHRSLIARWIKWSLMITELRIILENYTTITVSGLVNSGKSQLMRSLFGLDVSWFL